MVSLKSIQIQTRRPWKYFQSQICFTDTVARNNWSPDKWVEIPPAHNHQACHCIRCYFIQSSLRQFILIFTFLVCPWIWGRWETAEPFWPGCQAVLFRWPQFHVIVHYLILACPEARSSIAGSAQEVSAERCSMMHYCYFLVNRLGTCYSAFSLVNPLFVETLGANTNLHLYLPSFPESNVI